MRADLIERLRALAIHDCSVGGEIFCDPHEHIAWEAADALASQEPVAWQYRMLIGRNWTFWRDLNSTPEQFRVTYAFNLANGTAELRALFTSPVVPVAAKGEAEVRASELDFYLSDAENGICRVPRALLSRIRAALGGSNDKPGSGG